MKRFLLYLTVILLLCGCAAQENTVATVTPTETAGRAAMAAQPVTVGEPVVLECVVVNSVDGLLAAIAPGTQIVLEPGVYDLTTASNYGMDTGSLDYYWARKGNDYELTLTGVHDLTVRGSGRENTQIVTQPRYVNVLALDSCHNVRLEGFNAGHTEGAECAGGVVYAKDCEDIQLDQMGLYGCGTIGLWADGCTDVKLENSEIYDCSYSGVRAVLTNGLDIRNCCFRDIGDRRYGYGEVFYLDRCKNVNITGCSVSDNNVSCLVLAKPGAGIELRDTAFTRNRAPARAPTPPTAPGSSSGTGRTTTRAGGASTPCPQCRRTTRTTAILSSPTKIPWCAAGCAPAPTHGGWMWPTSCPMTLSTASTPPPGQRNPTPSSSARCGRTAPTKSPTTSAASIFWAVTATV